MDGPSARYIYVGSNTTPSPHGFNRLQNPRSRTHFLVASNVSNTPPVTTVITVATVTAVATIILLTIIPPLPTPVLTHVTTTATETSIFGKLVVRQQLFL
jgi:hypothetical protein